jgi:hypothetical protein
MTVRLARGWILIIAGFIAVGLALTILSGSSVSLAGKYRPEGRDSGVVILMLVLGGTALAAGAIDIFIDATNRCRVGKVGGDKDA